MQYSVSPDVLMQELEDEIVLLDLQGGRYFGLDEVGARAWQVLSETGDREQVVTTLLAEYDVDETTVRADVDALIQQLQEANLITPDDKQNQTGTE